MIYGIQQWGIRDLCKQDREKTYEMLVTGGINTIEPCVAVSDLGGIEKEIWDVPECIAQCGIMQKYGLEIDSLHIFSADLLESEKAILELVQNLMPKQIVLKLPMELTKEMLLETAYTYMRLADDLESYGVKVAIHNEARDIRTRIEGISAYEWFADACMDKIFMEVDVGWVLAGGEDPEAFLWRNRQRITSIHYKDFIDASDVKSETIFGQGQIDIKACVQFARAVGALQIFDQDVFSEDKIADISASRNAVDALAQYREHTISYLNILDTQTGKVKVLRKFDRIIEAPNWMKTQDHIIYNSEGRIWSYDVAADTEMMLGSGECNNCNNDHVLSPDEQYIAIGHSADNEDWSGSKIYKLPIQGGEPEPLISTAPSFLHGWSPDGKELAYCGFRTIKDKMEIDIYTCSTESGEERRLTEGGYNDGSEYSPDGKKIWFNSTKPGLMQIYRMNRDGSELTQMTDSDCNNWFAHVSPDGNHVVYLSFRKDDLQPFEHLPNMRVELWMMDSNGGNKRRMLSFFGGQGSINVNSWSKDARHLAFVSYELLHK